MKKILINVLLLLLITVVCKAQNGIVIGSFILISGDTISGSVKERLLNNHSAPVPIMNEKTNEERVVSRYEIKTILLANGQEAYQLWNVTLEVSYIDRQTLAVKNEGSTLKTDVLLQRIYDGAKLDLYYYHSETKDFYFVYTDGKMEELIIKYKTYESRNLPTYTNLYRVPSYNIFPLYRDQLLKYFDWQSNKKLALKINDLAYDKNKITAVIREIDKG